MTDCTNGDHGPSPWLCHVCDLKSTGESTACSVCYRTTCSAHLQTSSAYNSETGLYEIVRICVACALTGEYQG